MAGANKDSNGINVRPVADRRRLLLERRLHDAVESWSIAAHLSATRSPSARRDDFAAVAKAAQSLLLTLGLEKGRSIDQMPRSLRHGLQGEAFLYAKRRGGFPDLPPIAFCDGSETFIDWRTREKVANTVRDVQLLYQWAAAAQTRVTRQVSTSRLGRHKGDKALNVLFHGLIDVWTEFFERPVAASVGREGARNEGETTGPLVSFIQHILVM
jgi:hypothetical protein